MIFVNPNAKIHFFLETSKGKTVFRFSSIIFPSLIFRFAFAMAPFYFRSERDSWSVVIAKDKEKHSGELSPEFFVSLVNHLTTAFGACILIPELDVIAHTLWA
jgi:hypothetical protein